MAAKVLLIGSGAREHALSWKLAQSADVNHIFVSPGNAGTAKLGPKVSNVSLTLHDHSTIVDWCHAGGVSLVIVGPEIPLAEGIADSLTKAGISCFGPTAAAAKIESSKEFAKDLMTKNGIPTARWVSFTDSQRACQFIESADFPALVVKASGLAAGKGVIVASSREEAIKAVKEILEDKMFGEAGSTVVVEELLAGEEISCLAFCDGQSVVCMPPAQDHKRLLDDDKGPNTGGMGAYCPCDLISEAEMNFVKTNIIQKTVDALREAGSPFVGVLYAGIMLTNDGPKVLEFNCRFGDPETQVLIPLLRTDLFQVISHCVRGDLSSVKVEFDVSSTAVGVVLASSGYPDSCPKGLPITGLESAQSDFGVQVFYAGASCSGDAVVTSGGRVLTVVSKASSLVVASQKAQLAAERVNFDGKQFRKDIGHKALKKNVSSQVALTYKDSGVDIEAGDALVESIKGLAAATARPGCCPKLGLFGGLFDLSAIDCPGRLLVIGTDGVGTKLKVAQAINIHNTVGIDLVAMSVNDVLCQGAESLCFSDDFSCSRLSVEVARSVIEGISIGCRQAGCALIGGETAELPDTFKDGEYHLSGSAVGYVKKHLLLPKVDDVKSGDVVLGLTSSGLHSNGFSLVRKIVELCGLSYDIECPFDTTKNLGQYLLTPTKIYVKNLLPVLRMENKVKALAHITGGGLPGNVDRILPKNMRVVLDANHWVVPPVFGWIAEKGNVETSEMLRTFNCGIGMVIIVSEECAVEVQQLISQSGEEAHRIGHVIPRLPGDDSVEVRNIKEAFDKSYGPYRLKSDSVVVTCSSVRKKALLVKKRVAVLISGSGTNLQALMDFTRDPSNESSAEIALVISNVPSAFGLTRAANAGIASEVVNHKDFKTREEFDEAVHQVLVTKNIEIICLAGFMRILTGGFVRKWKGKMLNTHPSLLPSFKGAHAIRDALKAGVRKTGCSIHFVAEEVDAGAIIEQEAVSVNPGDTEDVVAERIKAAEHSAYPKALEMLASGKVMLTEDNRTKWL